MTSKPSITNCPKLSLACSYFPSFCGVCGIVVNDTFYVFTSCFFPGSACLRWCQPLTVASRCLPSPCMWDSRSPDGNQIYIPGGYCGGVPPLPIPNREVKPACADGTAMQCGRVGGRILFIMESLWDGSPSGSPSCVYEFYKFTSLQVYEL